MKKYITLILPVIVFLLTYDAKGQNEVQVAISDMKENSSTMMFILTKIDENMEKDKHKDLEKNIHDFKALATKVQETGSLFKDEYRVEIDVKCNALAKNVVQFEKTVHASKFLDKHDELESSISQLNSNTKDLRSYIDDLDAYANELLIEERIEIVYIEEGKPADEAVTSGGGVREKVSTQTTSDSSTKASLKNKSDAIGIQLDGINNAFKYKMYKDIGKYCNKIMDLCDDMSAGTSYESLSTSVTELKKSAHDLEHFSIEGHSKHDEMHHEHDHLKKLYSKISEHIDSNY